MLRQATDAIEIRYLDQGLHRYPQKMPALIQQQLEEIAPHFREIILGYGLCSNGIVGVQASRRLIVPRCHDCIAFFLGSAETYRRAIKARPGTYYLTSGWIREGQDPLGIVENTYMPRMGRETAVWGMREELKHYSHIVFINTGAGDPENLRRRAIENARFFKKQYGEIQASLDYLKKLLRGPYSDEDFILFEPGETVRQQEFLGAFSKKYN